MVAKQNCLFQQKIPLQREFLLSSARPLEVQQEIDRVYQQLVTKGARWGYNGERGLYNLLNFDELDVIAQRIQNASPLKKDLYFIDLGAGHFSWVDCVNSFLERHYLNDKRTFHVIGVTGEGEPFDYKEQVGNIVTHKINGFKLENLLESFTQFDLELTDSVEFITSSWTFCHLVDPLGTLEEAYQLLSRDNGFLFGTGFLDFYSDAGRNSLSETLKQAFGMHSYITRRRDSRPDDFALFRSAEAQHSLAKEKFSYDSRKPIIQLQGIDNCFAQCQAQLKSNEYTENIDHEFGGNFHGITPYVLEKLLGYEKKIIHYKENVFEKPLFEDMHFCKLYLDHGIYKVERQKKRNDKLE